ncbi:hypothetical protein F5Y19DRAFT_484075 [Xylariaceae sp. FL1651]|nr:hypothetical protein F5Y19DRAFT_484075 [Xylariaceae sp. FL1651]
MDESSENTYTATQIGWNWENECSGHQSSQSPVELTPPSTSSGTGTNPSSPDHLRHNDPSGASNRGDGDGNRNDTGHVPHTELAGVEFDSAIEAIISSAIAKSPRSLTREQAWRSVHVLSKNKIGGPLPEETRQPGVIVSSSTYPASMRSGTPEQYSTWGQSLPDGDYTTPIYRALSIDRVVGSSIIQPNDHQENDQSLLSHKLTISMHTTRDTPSTTPLSRYRGRIHKNSRRPARACMPSPEGNVPLIASLSDNLSGLVRTHNDVPGLRRGRPSGRGFSCSHCAIAKKKKPINSVVPDLYNVRIGALLDNVIEWAEHDHYAQTVEVAISNGFDSRLDVKLRRYVPLDENALTHKIFRGLEAGMVVPSARSTPFALQQGTLTSEKIDRYCDNMACDMIFQKAKHSARNTLVNHVISFSVAQVHSDNPRSRIEGLEMVQLALRFWALQAIFFAYPWRIVQGGDLAGMYPLELPGYWNGITLLPRLVNQELDRAFETRMDEIEKEILEKLQVAIFKRHRDNWCSIFLTSFIFLHGLESDTWNMSAWEHETKGRRSAAWPLERAPSEYCDQNRHISNILATHFRIVNQGCSPLNQDWKKPLNQQLLSNSVSARNFIMSIQNDFNSHTSS